MERPSYIEQINQRIATKPEDDAAAVLAKETEAKNKGLEAAYLSLEGITIDEAWFLDDDVKALLKAVHGVLNGRYRELGLSNPAPSRKVFDRAAAEHHAALGNSIVGRWADAAMDAAFDRRARVRRGLDAHNREQEKRASEWSNGRASEAEWRIKLKATEKWIGSDRDTTLFRNYITLYGNGIITGERGHNQYLEYSAVQKEQLEKSVIELFDKNGLSF